MNAIPVNIPPTKTYCRLLPHLDFVLSDIKPINGSVKASINLGTKAITPYNSGLNPRSWINTTINIDSNAGKS